MTDYDVRRNTNANEARAERYEAELFQIRNMVMGPWSKIYAEAVQTAHAEGRDILEVIFNQSGADVLVEVCGTGLTLEAVLNEYPQFEEDVLDWLEVTGLAWTWYERHNA